VTCPKLLYTWLSPLFPVGCNIYIWFSRHPCSNIDHIAKSHIFHFGLSMLSHLMFAVVKTVFSTT